MQINSLKTAVNDFNYIGSYLWIVAGVYGISWIYKTLIGG